MNENDSIPMPAMSEPNPIQEQAAEGELTFEWHRNEFGSKRDEYGDREVVDTAYQATAIIIEPEPDKVVQEQRQSVVRWRQEYQSKNYVVFKREAGFVAFRTDVMVGPREAASVELRTVTLDGPEPSLAWEVYTQTPHGGWEPVEGQHLHPRTAPAEQWQEETENIVLPKLIAQRTEVVAQ